MLNKESDKFLGLLKHFALIEACRKIIEPNVTKHTKC